MQTLQRQTLLQSTALTQKSPHNVAPHLHHKQATIKLQPWKRSHLIERSIFRIIRSCPMGKGLTFLKIVSIEENKSMRTKKFSPCFTCTFREDSIYFWRINSIRKESMTSERVHSFAWQTILIFSCTWHHVIVRSIFRITLSCPMGKIRHIVRIVFMSLLEKWDLHV